MNFTRDSLDRRNILFVQWQISKVWKDITWKNHKNLRLHYNCMNFIYKWVFHRILLFQQRNVGNLLSDIAWDVFYRMPTIKCILCWSNVIEFRNEIHNCHEINTKITTPLDIYTHLHFILKSKSYKFSCTQNREFSLLIKAIARVRIQYLCLILWAKMASATTYFVISHIFLLVFGVRVQSASDEKFEINFDTIKRIYLLKQSFNISNVISGISTYNSTENSDCLNELNALANGLTSFDEWAIQS